MDHLLVPIGRLAHAPLNIPYLCDERFAYDDHGFFSFPARMGVDLVGFQVLDASAVDHIAPFIQSWLWFGLISEVLYVGSRDSKAQTVTSHETFIRADHSGSRFVTTARLSEVVSAFSSKLQSVQFVISHLSRVEACLEMAARATHEIITSPAFQSHLRRFSSFRNLSVTFDILLSVQLLIESLDLAISNLIPHRPLRSPWRIFRHVTDSQLVNFLLQEAGWTPQVQSWLPTEWTLRYFLSFIHPAKVPGQENSLRLGHSYEPTNTVESVEYFEPSHVCHSGECLNMTMQSSDIATLWEKGLIPVLKLGSESDRHARLIVEAVEPVEHSNYICISHARCTGLGNTSANSLPYCQLSRIQAWVNELCPEGSTTAFWIDTMCLPRHPNAKRPALQRLQTIYSQAAKVLVLDPWLIKHMIGCSEDALIRLRCSVWFQRLWTIQEGAVARDLRLAFGNGLFSLQSLIKDYEEKTGSRMLRSCHIVDMLGDSLLATLASVNEDVKEMTYGQSSLQHGVLNSDIHRILRFGYLAFPRYRYLRSLNEHVDMVIALEALKCVYMHVDRSAKMSRTRTLVQRGTDLRRLVEFVASRRPSDDERKLIELNTQMM